MANNTVCPIIAQPTDSDITLSTYNVTSGTQVLIGCKSFGHRVVGPHDVTCLPSGQWSDTTKPDCKWTWELTTHEKIVLGTSIAAGAFLIIIIFTIIVAYCCCYKRRKRLENEQKGFGSVYCEDRISSKKHDYDAYGPPIIETGPGVYPDAYYAYQEYPDKSYPSDMSDVSGLDRPWLGYIPRPKVAEGRYYH